MVLVSKENKRKIYEYLLSEIVIVIKKESQLLKQAPVVGLPQPPCSDDSQEPQVTWLPPAGLLIAMSFVHHDYKECVVPR